MEGTRQNDAQYEKQSTLGCGLICGGGCLLNINQRLSQALGTARREARSQEKVMRKKEAIGGEDWAAWKEVEQGSLKREVLVGADLRRLRECGNISGRWCKLHITPGKLSLRKQ